MKQTVELLRGYAKKLIYVESNADLKNILTVMHVNEISLLPIIDHSKKVNIGVYKRKNITEAIISQNKSLAEIEKNDIKEEKLPEVDIRAPLNEAMEKLESSSAVLVRNENNEYELLITPRVISNFLRDYAEHYFIIETLENLIRKKIIEKQINYKDIDSHKFDKEFDDDPNKLDFGQYHLILSNKWEDFDLMNFDKDFVLKLIDDVRNYRNSLMHFRQDEKLTGLGQAKKLLKIFE